MENDIRNIPIDLYNYTLPDERIAKFPLPNRDQSRLLVRAKDGNISDTTFSNLAQYLPEKSLLVFNNTKVIQARLIFHKENGTPIEIFCLEPKIPADYAQIFIQNKSCTWLCLVGKSKRWKEGKLKLEVEGAGYKVPGKITAERLESYGDTHLIRFEWDNPEWSFAEILESVGELPIPPYLNRKTEELDKETYQTVYSKIKGSVAAPTAGLHFTPAVFDSLKEKQIDCEELTLHVGAGTFKPVKTETIANHEMHSECFTVKKSTIEKLLNYEGNIIAVGTTSVRTLESLYFLGALLHENPELPMEQFSVTQWMPYTYEKTLLPSQALRNLLTYLEKNKLNELTARTQIMIVPGYQFKLIKGLITNFHQPKSTLLLLISAFLNEKWEEVYNYALAHDFRFLSYGDSSYLEQ